MQKSATEYLVDGLAQGQARFDRGFYLLRQFEGIVAFMPLRKSVVGGGNGARSGGTEAKSKAHKAVGKRREFVPNRERVPHFLGNFGGNQGPLKKLVVAVVASEIHTYFKKLQKLSVERFHCECEDTSRTRSFTNDCFLLIVSEDSGGYPRCNQDRSSGYCRLDPSRPVDRPSFSHAVVYAVHANSPVCWGQA